VPPLLLLLMAENREIAREVWLLPQWTQGAGASALLMGRSFSKIVSQSAQRYSYIGIFRP
jgi:3-hydroxy-3-methylglutaryl CoA synthase